MEEFGDEKCVSCIQTCTACRPDARTVGSFWGTFLISIGAGAGSKLTGVQDVTAKRLAGEISPPGGLLGCSAGIRYEWIDDR